jgi:hypothetical protein
MPRNRHPKKEVEEALDYVDNFGWRVEIGGSHAWGRGSIARTTTRNVGVANSVFQVFGVHLEAQQIMRNRFAGWSITAARKVKDGTVQLHSEIRTSGA